MGQIQCPNCGGYDLKATPSGDCLEDIIILATLPFLIGFFLIAESEKNDWKKFHNGTNTADCKLCGYKFYKSELPDTPIPANQSLINASRKRLKEEEEHRRRMMDD
jgi:hypothetical protein